MITMKWQLLDSFCWYNSGLIVADWLLCLLASAGAATKSPLQYVIELTMTIQWSFQASYNQLCWTETIACTNFILSLYLIWNSWVTFDCGLSSNLKIEPWHTYIYTYNTYIHTYIHIMLCLWRLPFCINNLTAEHDFGFHQIWQMLYCSTLKLLSICMYCGLSSSITIN